MGHQTHPVVGTHLCFQSPCQAGAGPEARPEGTRPDFPAMPQQFPHFRCQRLPERQQDRVGLLRPRLRPPLQDRQQEPEVGQGVLSPYTEGAVQRCTAEARRTTVGPGPWPSRPAHGWGCRQSSSPRRAAPGAVTSCPRRGRNHSAVGPAVRPSAWGLPPDGGRRRWAARSRPPPTTAAVRPAGRTPGGRGIGQNPLAFGTGSSQDEVHDEGVPTIVLSRQPKRTPLLLYARNQSQRD